jgi:multidrug transporter EmrE-like cation transporter
MPMHTPSKWIFILALVLAVLALIGALAHVPYLTVYAVWLAIAAYVVLALGCIFKTA